MKCKMLATLVIVVTATDVFSQSFLFKHNTGVSVSEGTASSKICYPYILGDSNIAVSIISFSDEDGSNESRFYVFDIKGKLLKTVFGKDQGWTDPSVVTSPTGSFLLGGSTYNPETDTVTWAEDRLYVYNKKTKVWTPHASLGKDVIWSAADGGKALSSAIWAEMKNESGELVLCVYRF